MNEQEWLECTDPMPMLFFLRGKITDRKWRLFAVTCCRHILPLMGEEPWQAIVEVAERYADGIAGDRERLEALRDVKEQWFSPTTTLEAALVQYGHDLFKRCLDKRVKLWCKESIGSVDLPCWSVTRDTRSDQWITLKAGEGKWHVSILGDILGNPFRPVTINPAWLTWNDGTVIKIAQAIYDEKAFDRMHILADALEDAGCDNADILNHCRSDSPHVKGCWVIDLLLGKE